jgi:branched-chain amino acid transport system ATP-binding protein
VRTETVLELDGLAAGYAGNAVVRDLNLTVRRGEIVALLGSNGAGKTTTLRAISGLIRPMRGAVLFDGQNISEMSATDRSRRGLAMLPEGRGIFHGLTVGDHFRLGYGGAPIDPAEVYAYFPRLEQLRNRRVGLLSGGEQQMLAVARVLVSRRRLILFDELSLGLAPVILDTLFPILRRFSTENGVALLIVEQFVERALGVADHAYVLSHGTMTLQGSAEELKRDRNLLKASYLGDAFAPLA